MRWKRNTGFDQIEDRRGQGGGGFGGMLGGGGGSALPIPIPGGKAGGGAQLTALGRQVLAQYQAMATATERACAKEIAALRRLRRK